MLIVNIQGAKHYHSGYILKAMPENVWMHVDSMCG